MPDTPDSAFWWILTGAAVLTSAVSGVLGMAGGVILLSIMLLRLDPVVAIPVHGVVQMASNGFRVWFQRKHVAWRAVWPMLLPLIPAVAIGVLVVSSIPAGAARIAVAVFTLLATWAPGRLALLTRPHQNARFGMVWGGALIGFLTPILGATGLLLAPFIMALELGAQATVGTLAACQLFQHAAKVACFGIGGFDLGRYLVPCLLLCAAAFLGSLVGARVLDRVPQHVFKPMVRWVVTALALTLLYQGVRA